MKSILKTISTALLVIGDRIRKREIVLAIGFSRWKRPFVQKLLRDCAIIFIDEITPLRVALRLLHRTRSRCVVWSFKDEELKIPEGLLKDSSIERIEDGFVRSIGRGIDHAPPWSFCIDPIGMYYDATRPSALEYLCNNLDHHGFKLMEKHAAAAMSLLLSTGITKYNGIAASNPAHPPIYRPDAVLVLGQVEDDASITRNKNAISTNKSLLERAVSDNPSSMIYFKQHPDCLGARRRAGYINCPQSERIIEVDPDVSLPEALTSVDIVYTISSLGGFEALLRGKRVVTFGNPFYAGWGLTTDHVAFPRRKVSLSILELFYVAYMQYPAYLNPHTGQRLALINVIQELSSINATTIPNDS